MTISSIAKILFAIITIIFIKEIIPELTSNNWIIDFSFWITIFIFLDFRKWVKE